MNTSILWEMRYMNTSNSSLSILILGIGDFFSKYYYHTSFVIFPDESPVFVDCPDPLPKMLYEASQKSGVPLGLDDIDHVILTHLHGDHANGLESLGFYNRFLRHRKPILHTIPEVADVLWDRRLKSSMGPCTNADFESCGEMRLEDFFRLHILHPDKIHSIKGMKIQIHYTRHFIPCFGFKIAYKGRTFGYSSDTAFYPEHIRFLSDCDLILHETNKGGHTQYEKLLTLPEEIRRKMMLIHIYDDFDIEKSKIPVAREGCLYSI